MRERWVLNLVAERDKQIAALTADNAALRQALTEAFRHCGCSLRERDSGHRVDCWLIQEEWADIIQSPSPGTDLLKRHAEELAGARKLADCWTKAETALNDIAMERDALRLRHAEEQQEWLEAREGFDQRKDALVKRLQVLEPQVIALRQRAEAAEERENRLDRLAEVQDRALAALTKERDEATARANAAREALDKIADFELGGGDPWKAVTFLQEIAEMPLAEATEPVAQSEGGK